jgi:hypothetical protein
MPREVKALFRATKFQDEAIKISATPLQQRVPLLNQNLPERIAAVPRRLRMKGP